MKNKDNVRMLDHETIREDFTQHGFHLNATGKIKLRKLMSQNISKLFEAKKKHPIISKWRTTHNDPNLVKSILKIISEDHVVIDNNGRNEDHVVIDNKGRNEDHVVIDNNGRNEDHMVIDNKRRNEDHVVIDKKRKKRRPCGY
jgi:hypothetical protein